MSAPIIDWKAIRPLDGLRNKGFEELCAQFARYEIPDASHFERKGTPDAGVECYAVLSNGNEWGWQAKYFDNLGHSQWIQLDDSIKTALEKHPKLVRYFVCVPLDLPDARIGRRMSAKEHWNHHVKTWIGWASSRSMTVDFVYWGASELLERLTRPQYIGRIRFWFDIHKFNIEWFKSRLDEALKTAGPRYTPEINVDLPIAYELAAFGRTEHFFDEIKSQALTIRKKFRDLDYYKPKSGEQRITTEISTLSSQIQTILSEFGSLTAQPTGILPFNKIAALVSAAVVAASRTEDLLLECERIHDTKSQVAQPSTTASVRNNNPFRDCRYVLLSLSSALENAREVLVHADMVASSSLMLLRGDAGTGKTHLLCDVTRQRIAAGKPTVLLMGQRFISPNEPWTQALQQLDLAALSTEEFVGALESAAQAAGCRALLIIDAINEGSGSLIWPSHLAAFLAQLDRSPWIGVLLSFRSSYEQILISEEIRSRAFEITHQGFTEHEYDATQTFFIHYNIELPSTPLLSPEFRNPLFLKTLCRGLSAKGESRLPRGFHGFTTIFKLYLDSINDRLASALGFNPRHFLVEQALEGIAEAMVNTGNHWLTLKQTEEIADTLLPGRTFEKTLYRGLIVEGILIEEVISQKDGTPQEVVVMAYERLTDHLVTKILLDKYLNLDIPASAFAIGAPLAFIWDKSRYITPGLLEAMCIQISERTKQELVLLAPNVIDHWGIGNAFRQSLIWRDPSAFSKGTLDVLNKLIRNEQDSDDTLDVLLTVATLVEHPFNAKFLNQRLRKNIMPDRDAWWSIYLHHAWGTHGAVDRLVSWAHSVMPSTVVDENVTDLCAMVLAWMLSTSNRFLRDNTTQALINLLTGRTNAVIQLIQQFSDVDDLYIVERIYAVAYGVTMRSDQSEQVGALAQIVYNFVFASGVPPSHILLRDYARGIVERAIFLGAGIDIVEERIRPPYRSEWPTIPNADEIKPFLPDWSRGSHESRDTEWARNRIGSSVMSDDFAHYVISTSWSSLRLDEPKWQSPEARIAILLKDFSEAERVSWEKYKAADNIVKALPMNNIIMIQKELQEGGPSDKDKYKILETNVPDPELESAIKERDTLLKEMESILTKQHSSELEILLKQKNKAGAWRPPQFDVRLIQRYIIKRVFDLGWTTKRFGQFDRFSIGYKGRESHKAERIGKKYQWIAYHEIMALIADHFQYGTDSTEEANQQTYDGPWQEHLRDIDPSCTLRGSRKNTYLDTRSPSLYRQVPYDNWGEPDDARSWSSKFDDVPKVLDLFTIIRPDDNSKWLNVQSFFLWQQPVPADQNPHDIEHRELWYIINGYLIHVQDQEAFIKWAENMDFYGRWMPDPPEVYRMFLGEYQWSPAFRYFQHQYFHDFGGKGWIQPNHGCPVKIKPVAFEYLREAVSYDCSVEESFSLRLPADEIVTGLALHWNGTGVEYVDSAGRIITFNPTANNDGAESLLIREDSIRDLMEREGLTICWAILGGKMAIGSGFGNVMGELRISGAYILGANGPEGFTNYVANDYVPK